MMTKIVILKKKINLNYILRFISYHSLNTLAVGYKNPLVSAI